MIKLFLAILIKNPPFPTYCQFRLRSTLKPAREHRKMKHWLFGLRPERCKDNGPKEEDYYTWVAWEKGKVETRKASQRAKLSLSSRLPRQSSTPPLAQYLRDALDGVPTCFCSAVQREVFVNKTRRINDTYKRQLYPTTLKIG